MRTAIAVIGMLCTHGFVAWVAWGIRGDIDHNFYMKLIWKEREHHDGD